MNEINKATILAYFDELYPNVKGELLYNHDYELLIAVVLSAQATDKQVNIVTRKFFALYETFASLLPLKVEDYELHFKSIGLYRNKAKHIYGLVQQLNKDHGGVVPSSKRELLKLPGVGIKTANVVRSELFKIPEVAVDTHVSRIAKRLGFATFSNNVGEIEKKLRKALPKEKYIKTHHQMIHFGRYFCKATSPNCKNCALVALCKEPNKNL